MRVSHRAFLRHVGKARWWVPGRHMGGDGLHSNVYTLHDYLQLALMLRHPDLQIPHDTRPKVRAYFEFGSAGGFDK